MPTSYDRPAFLFTFTPELGRLIGVAELDVRPMKTCYILRSYILLSVLLLTRPIFAADDSLLISLKRSVIDDVAIYYSTLTGKTVTYSNNKFKLWPITVDTYGVPLSKKQAIRFLESALYLKGIEIIPKDDSTVEFKRYANIIDPKTGEFLEQQYKSKGK